MRKSVDHVNQTGTVPADDVLEAVHAVMHLARSRLQRAGRDDTEALTPMEGRVLGFFARHPGATQRELAEHSGRDKGQLARLIGSLKERGLLDAQPDEHDGRVTRLVPTATARQHLQALQRQRRQLAQAAAAGFSDEERRTLLALLQRLHDNLDALP